MYRIETILFLNLSKIYSIEKVHATRPNRVIMSVCSLGFEVLRDRTKTRVCSLLFFKKIGFRGGPFQTLTPIFPVVIFHTLLYRNFMPKGIFLDRCMISEIANTVFSIHPNIRSCFNTRMFAYCAYTRRWYIQKYEIETISCTTPVSTPSPGHQFNLCRIYLRIVVVYQRICNKISRKYLNFSGIKSRRV